MKIVLLSDTEAPHTRRWAQWFARRGHEVHVVSFNSRGLPGYEPAIVHTVWEPRFGNSLPERMLKLPFILTRLRRLLRRFPPDVLHAHSAAGYAVDLLRNSGFTSVSVAAPRGYSRPLVDGQQ